MAAVECFKLLTVAHRCCRCPILYRFWLLNCDIVTGERPKLIISINYSQVISNEALIGRFFFSRMFDTWVALKSFQCFPRTDAIFFVRLNMVTLYFAVLFSLSQIRCRIKLRFHFGRWIRASPCVCATSQFAYRRMNLRPSNQCAFSRYSTYGSSLRLRSRISIPTLFIRLMTNASAFDSSVNRGVVANTGCVFRCVKTGPRVGDVKYYEFMRAG